MRTTILHRMLCAIAEATADECVEWPGSRDRQGYGRVRRGDRHLQAHRVVFEAIEGPIPAGLEIDHLCRNTSCVNPDHLEPVTRAENIRRRTVLIVRCIHGHEFTPENTYVTPRGKRACRACGRANSAAYLRRRQAREAS